MRSTRINIPQIIVLCIVTVLLCSAVFIQNTHAAPTGSADTNHKNTTGVAAVKKDSQVTTNGTNSTTKTTQEDQNKNQSKNQQGEKLKPVAVSESSYDAAWAGSGCTPKGKSLECRHVQNVMAKYEKRSSIIVKSTSTLDNRVRFVIRRGFVATIGHKRPSEQFKEWRCFRDVKGQPQVSCAEYLEVPDPKYFKCHTEWPLGRYSAVKCAPFVGAEVQQYFGISKPYDKGGMKIYLSRDEDGLEQVGDPIFTHAQGFRDMDYVQIVPPELNINVAKYQRLYVHGYDNREPLNPVGYINFIIV
eukprot:Nk52_evm8s263 gene=Nk52_evmTU8s263